MRNSLLHLNFICWKNLESDFIKKQIMPFKKINAEILYAS
jgi:hypothetical protein